MNRKSLIAGIALTALGLLLLARPGPPPPDLPGFDLPQLWRVLRYAPLALGFLIVLREVMRQYERNGGRLPVLGRPGLAGVGIVVVVLELFYGPSLFASSNGKGLNATLAVLHPMDRRAIAIAKLLLLAFIIIIINHGVTSFIKYKLTRRAKVAIYKLYKIAIPLLIGLSSLAIAISTYFLPVNSTKGELAIFAPLLQITLFVVFVYLSIIFFKESYSKFQNYSDLSNRDSKHYCFQNAPELADHFTEPSHQPLSKDYQGRDDVDYDCTLSDENMNMGNLRHETLNIFSILCKELAFYAKCVFVFALAITVVLIIISVVYLFILGMVFVITKILFLFA